MTVRKFMLRLFPAILPLFVMLGLSSVYGKITPAQFEYLNELLDLNRIEELIATGEELKQGNQENLELRALLFQAYLTHNLPDKAEQEISFMESRIRNAQTLYLRALQAYYTNDAASALAFLDQITEKRYAPPYLLYYRIRMEERKFNEAERYLQQYRGLEGEDQNWFFYYGQYLLSRYNPDVGEAIARNHIQRYAQIFPPNHRQMYLRADYHATLGQFDLALNFIDRALYLSSTRPDYLDRKIYYLYRDRQFNALNQVIDENVFYNQELFIHYQWLKSFVNFLQLKQENRFTLRSPQQLYQVLDPLEKILAQNPENLVIRYFAEEILIANTLINDPRRKPYAIIRHNRGNYFTKRGLWEDADYAFTRMNLLSSNESGYLESYLEYLRVTQQYERYQIEAEKYLRLFPQSNQEHRNIPIRKQLVEKAIAESLASRYALTELIPPPQTRALLTYTPKGFSANWDQPFLDTLVVRMIREALEIPPLMRVTLAPYTRADQIATRLTQENYDYHLDSSLRDTSQVLTLNLIVRDREKTIIYNQPFAFYGKDRYQKMVTKLQQWAYEIFPKVGRVAAVNERQVVISLGRRHGAKLQDMAVVYKDGVNLGSFPLEIVDNYYSLITIDKIFTLSKTEIGDRVILESKQ